MRRLKTGGRIDRSKPLTMSFGGKTLTGFAGDTLASALLANQVRLVGRSFKYHRPRGIYSAGAEEPNAMVHLRDGGRHEPNARATQTEAFDGLTSSPQNAWPSLDLDVGSINNLLSPVFSAGFYYKTFIGPFSGTKFWMQCEDIIRRSAGMGTAYHRDDPDSYDKVHAFCDVLVIGGGIAGISAALAAARAGAKVILAEQDVELGGALLSDPIGGPGDDWLTEAIAELHRLPNVQILTRTCVFGAYESDTYALIERVDDAGAAPSNEQVRQRYWQVHAHRSVMATGAIERPLVFAGNDLPGVMLAGAVRTYLNRYGVLTGERVVILTNNDSAYPLAQDLNAAGADVHLVDMRPNPALAAPTQAAGITVSSGKGVLKAKGGKRLKEVAIVPVDRDGRATGPEQRIKADVLAVSGGWSPVVHLWSQLYRKPVHDPKGACFVPERKEDHHMIAAGAGNGAARSSEAVAQGFEAGREAAAARNHCTEIGTAPSATADQPSWRDDFLPVWKVTDSTGKCAGKAFVDLQHDVKLSDVDQAHLEGYVSVEHLKRYTTTGMATDQGKLSNVNALARMAELRGMAIDKVGTTTFRPPYTPITIGAIVGHECGRHFRPVRHTPLHDWHRDNGAQMTEAGAWMRPWYYGAADTLGDSYIAEAGHVRTHVGMTDVSTLGKIAVQGPDAAEFLNRIYTNGWKTLAVGRLRYGVMLREDGIVMDDGATARIGEQDYFMTTTTANAARVLANAEKLLQTAWRDLKVHVTSVSDQWAAIALAGPKSRDVLGRVAIGADVSAQALPNNHLTYGTVAGVQVRIHRMSYSGELAYEIYVSSGSARTVWQAIYDAGQPDNLRPYGTEAMGALRIEKGHVAGAEIDGRTTMSDLGLAGLASSKKPFVGSVLRNRSVLTAPDRPTLVGLEVAGDTGARSGSLLFPNSGDTTGHGDGWVSSTTYSPALGKYIALGLLKDGRDRIGETVRIISFVDNQVLTAKVVSHHFYDPEGKRQNA